VAHFQRQGKSEDVLRLSARLAHLHGDHYLKEFLGDAR
jgi:hypothetical protein